VTTYVAFKNLAKEEGLGLNFEFTARQMPQQNGCIEQKYATLFGQVQVMLNSAGLNEKYDNLHQGLWVKCASMATRLANIMAPSGKQLPHFQFLKTNPSFVLNLHVFGEIGIVNDAAPLHSKLANCGIHCMFVRYAEDNASDTFKMFNLKTHCVWQTRNICWVATNIIKFDELSNNPLTMTNNNDEDDNDDKKIQTHANANNNNNEDDEDTDNDEDKDADDDDKDDNDDANNG